MSITAQCHIYTCLLQHTKYSFHLIINIINLNLAIMHLHPPFDSWASSLHFRIYRHYKDKLSIQHI